MEGCGEKSKVEEPVSEQDSVLARVRECHPRILLMDDSKFLADILATFFRLDGFTPRAVYDGTEALAAIREQMPHIAFLDVAMPGMDGLEVARAIRREHPQAAVILVALSGWDEPHHRLEAKEAGFDHFLAKPVDAVGIREFLCREIVG